MVYDLRKHRKERDSFPQFAFSLCCSFHFDSIPDRNSLKEKRFLLAYVSGVHAVHGNLTPFCTHR